MSKKKDCFGSETYVCMTRACPYMSECVKVVWEKKLRRIIARRPGSVSPRDPSTLKTAGGVRLRSKEFLPGSGDARGV